MGGASASDLFGIILWPAEVTTALDQNHNAIIEHTTNIFAHISSRWVKGRLQLDNVQWDRNQ